MTKISAVIITHNEGKHIGTCIESLDGVADEVIVVDSCSADDTAAIARSKGAKVIEKEFMGFGPQKNYGASQASHDHILSIDADEALSDELKKAISRIKVTAIAGSYYVHRLNHIGSIPIRTCGWYPDIRTRLYNRKEAQWDNKAVHEALVTKNQPSYLPGDLLHYSYSNYDEMRDRAESYGRLGAQQLQDKSTLYLLVKIIVNPIAKFVKSYILQRGYADGYAGWMISRYKMRETFLKYYLALQ